MLEWLVRDRGARVNAADGDGATPLALAARVGHGPVVAFLLASGASFSAADSRGWTPACWALAMGHVDVLQAMANFGVPLDQLGGLPSAPFSSPWLAPSSLLPLACVRYRAAQHAARLEEERREIDRRAEDRARRERELQEQREREVKQVEERYLQRRVRDLKKKYMRDVREDPSQVPQF